MRILAAAICATAALGPIASRASGDTTAPGYIVRSEVPIPLYASFASLPGGGILLFDGDRIRILPRPGLFEMYLGTVPAFVYPSFVLVHPTQAFALIGESSNGDILHVDFPSDSHPILTRIPFNFDATWEDARHLFLSAAPCFSFCGNRIWRLDTTSGAQVLVANVTGPSGPLARAANGDLYYGLQSTTYPPPPDSIRIIRWTAAQVQSGSVLSESDATTIVPGLDGASSLEIDPLRGHLWVASSRWPGGSEVLEFLPDGTPLGQVIASPHWIANLEVTSPGYAPVQAFTPSRPLRLRYAAVDYGLGTARLVTVLPTSPAMPRARW